MTIMTSTLKKNIFKVIRGHLRSIISSLNFWYLHIKAFKFSWQWVWKLRRVDLVPSLDRLSGDQASRSVASSG